MVTAEARVTRTPDGRVWTVGGPGEQFWSRYLAAFDSVRLVARVLDSSTVSREAVRVDGSSVEVWAVPHYVGLRGYVLRNRTVRRAVRSALNDADAVILRVPSPLGSVLARLCDRLKRPYALEVVGDPYDVFAPKVVKHPLRPFIRRFLTAGVRRQCRSACAISYVTETTLQSRYPPKGGVPAWSISSIDLPITAFAKQPRTIAEPPKAPSIISVGSLEQMYKGIDTLIEAVAELARRGIHVSLMHIGGGKYMAQLRQLAERLQVADKITLVGPISSGAAVRAHLNSADLFVLPSRTEGLPRALIEAMALGLPAVCTTVGGIPELLSSECMVPPNDPMALARAIERMLADPGLMSITSKCNLDRAKAFSGEVLGPRRAEFYQAVRLANEQTRAFDRPIV